MYSRSYCCGVVVMNPTRNHEVVGSVPALAQWVNDLALPCRRSSDPALLWLWRRLVATAPLAWELPYVVGAAQERAKRQKIKKKKMHVLQSSLQHYLQ